MLSKPSSSVIWLSQSERSVKFCSLSSPSILLS
jgi:hypothetical protein